MLLFVFVYFFIVNIELFFFVCLVVGQENVGKTTVITQLQSKKKLARPERGKERN
jgi:GTP-binding protein EngB required for normal cell division